MKVNITAAGLKAGYRSGLEEKTSVQLDEAGVGYGFETQKIKFVEPAKNRTYTPDFVLTKKNGEPMYIETKGRLVAADRKKHKMIKDQHPELDIRFVFSNVKSKIYKGSPTTHGMWAEKLGVPYSNKVIPIAWIEECL